MIQFDGPAHIFDMSWETKPPKQMQKKCLDTEVSLETAGLPPRSGTLLCVPLNATMDTARCGVVDGLLLGGSSQLVPSGKLT